MQSALRDLFKVQIPFLYDMFAEHWHQDPLTSLTWLPGSARPRGALQQRLALGSCGASSALELLSVRIPWQDGETADSWFPKKRGAPFLLHATHRMPLEGPARCVACCPQRHELLAAQCGDVLLFDLSRWEALPSPAGGPGGCCPDGRLRSPAGGSPEPSAPCGHPGGFGGRRLDWSREGMAPLLLAGSCGGEVCLWDTSRSAALQHFQVHPGARLTHLEFSTAHPTTFVTCATDGGFCLWDSRDMKCGVPPRAIAAGVHGDAALCGSFGGGGDAVLATGGEDGAVKLWDPRQLQRSLHTLRWSVGASAHAVLRICWAPFDAGLLATAGGDGAVLLWDLCRIAERPRVEDPPELVFVHGGHPGAPPVDVAWSADAPWLLGSLATASPTSPSGELQLWCPAEALR